MEESVIEMNIEVFGFVQGVSFRNWTKRLAKQLKLTGRVQNTNKGTVEIFAQGKKHDLTKFIEIIRETEGPRIASIENITVREVPMNKQYSDFVIVKI